MTKKLLGLLMFFCLGIILSGAISVNALGYKLSDNEITITFCDLSTNGQVDVPANIDGYPVTKIGDNAFKNCTKLDKVTLPATVTSIGENAFYGCVQLFSVEMTDAVTSIGKSAFDGCTNLTVMNLSKNIQTIGDRAFYKTYLDNITLPECVISIGNDAFCESRYYNNTNNWKNNILYINKHLIEVKYTVTGEITVDDGTLTIADNAFGSCQITGVNLPDSIVRIGNSAFSWCQKLKTITIPESVTFIGENAFNCCYALKELRIPGNISKISDGMFGHCSALASITIPESVTTIGVSAFESCSNLSVLTMPESVTKICESAFNRCYVKTVYYTGKVGEHNKIQIDANNSNIQNATWYGMVKYKFVDEDGRVILEEKVFQDKKIQAPEAPTKPATQQYTYTFAGWDGYTEDMTVAEDTTFKATYSETVNQYNYKFVDENGNVLQEDTVDYGTVPESIPEGPAKAPTQQYTYTFAGWTGYSEGMAITDHITFTPRYDATVNQYTYKFLDEDGSVISEQTADYGTKIELPETPSKAETEMYTYPFAGWEGYTEDMVVTEDVTFTAKYTETIKRYTYKFISDGAVVFEDTVDHGTEIIAPENPVKAATPQYTYSFAGWDGYTEGMCAVGDVTFTAIYTETINRYTYTFIDEDGTVIFEATADYGTEIKAPADLFKPATQQYTYTFNGWEGYTNGMTVTGDAVFKAMYSETVNQYTYRFVDVNGIVVFEETADYGTKIKVPQNPEKPATQEYTYTFVGWDGYAENMTVTEDVTFVSVYTATVNQYTYTFKDEDGRVIYRDTVNYGTLITDLPENPFKAATKQYTYTFSGWDGYVKNYKVTEDVVFTAKYNATVNRYTYKFVDEDGKLIFEETADYGTKIKVPEAPTKPATKQYTYTFNGWDGYSDGMNLTEDKIFTAKYNAAVNQYTYTFINNGDIYFQKTVDYGTKIELPEAPSRVPTAMYTFTFDRWDAYTEGMIITEDISFTAVYTQTINMYTYQFVDYNGDVIFEKTVPCGTRVETPPDPVKPGDAQYSYVFRWWSPYAPNMQINCDIVIKPTFMPVINRYTYKFVDESGKVLLENTVDYGTKITSAPEVPGKGVSFIGIWQGYTPEMEVTGDVTFTPVYTYKDYTITIHDTDEKVTVTYNSKFSIEPAEKYGYEFKGYFDAPNGSGNKLTNESGQSYTPYLMDGDLTVYPYFVPEFITSVTNHGHSMFTGDTEAFIGNPESTAVHFYYNLEMQDSTIWYADFTIRIPNALDWKTKYTYELWSVEEISRTVTDDYTDVTFRCRCYYNSGYIPQLSRESPFTLLLTTKEGMAEGCYTISNPEIALYRLNNKKIEYTLKETFSHTIHYQYPAVQSVEIVGEDVISEKTTFTANVTPDFVQDTTVTWSVDDETVATIDQNGVLSPLKSGNVVVTVRSNADENVYATKNVTVNVMGLNSVVTDIGVWNKPFSVNNTEYKIYVDANKEICNITPVFYDEDMKVYFNENEAWQSGDAITVPLNEKETTLTCKCEWEDGTSKEYTFEITRFTGIYAWVSEDKSIVNVVAGGAPEGTAILAVYYNEDTMVGWQNKPYDKKRIDFTINEPYTKVKLFAWKKLDNITPVLPAATFDFTEKLQ